MTQQQIDRLNNLREIRYSQEKATRDQARYINNMITSAKRECDHKKPDGTSAVKSFFLFNACTICHANDL